jgi:uncharacterized protein (TIGR02611 family)
MTSTASTTPAPRSQRLVHRVDEWAHRGPVRALVVKIGVTVAGPLFILAGVAMLVLPGPGLVVMASGVGLLALEYEWARRVGVLAARVLGRARRAVFPQDSSGSRRALGVAASVAFLVATTLLTGAVTTYVGATLV